ncbi:MAG TPA: polyprenyl synthetase family protein [Anaerolineaceae bacterium]|nr:polyprenyl synthetase family protein [Anaerolineaceae bacterium]
MVPGTASSPGLGIPGFGSDLGERGYPDDAFQRTLDTALKAMGVGGNPPGGRPGSLLFLLPALCCEAAGGESATAAPIVEAWTGLYAVAHLLDMVEDGDLIPAWAGMPGRSINLATGLIFRTELLLARLEDHGIPRGCARQLRERFNQSILHMCAGQDLGFSSLEPTLETAWQIADAKSGSFFELGCVAGARLATRSKKVLHAFADFGFAVGRLVQIGDDLKDLSVGENGDLATGHWGLPLAYAMQALPDEKKKHLGMLVTNAWSDVQAQDEARRMILESGARVYLRSWRN